MGKRRRSTQGVILWGTILTLLQAGLVVAAAANPSTQRTTGAVGHGKYGDRCLTEQDCIFLGSKCENGICVCQHELPATNQVDKCGKGANLNESCFFNEQCELFNPVTECRDGVCICRFEKEGIINPDGTTDCIAINTPMAPEQYIAPTMIAILVVMCLMFIILCVVLRLFSRERWRENRTIFNTPNPRLMNVSLLRDSKHGDRRGSKASAKGPSRHASMGSLRLNSPSLQGLRRNSKTGSNMSLKSTLKSPVDVTANPITTPTLEKVTVEIRNAKA